MPTVVLHGLAVDCPIGLPGLPRSPHDEAEPVTVHIETGGVAPASGHVAAEVHDEASGRDYVLSRDGGAWVAVFPGVATVRWADGDSNIRVVADPSTPGQLLGLLLAGPALSALLLARGVVLLHASAVAWTATRPAHVVAFAGPSGAGKSTLARLLATGERTLFSDDALRIEPDPASGRIITHRGTVVTRLRRQDRDATSRSWSPDGRRLVADDRPAPPIGRLALVCMPRLSPGFTQPALHRLGAVPATASLGACWPVAGVRDPDLMRRHLSVAAQTVRLTGVVQLDVPWNVAAGGAEVRELARPLAALVEAELAAAEHAP